MKGLHDALIQQAARVFTLWLLLLLAIAGPMHKAHYLLRGRKDRPSLGSRNHHPD